MSELTNRVRILEQQRLDDRRRIVELEARMARAELNIQQIRPGGGGGGGTLSSYWCLTPSAVGPATGSWGTLTPDSFTADVYHTVAGAQTLLIAGATIYWWFNDTSGVGTPCPLMPNADGSYDVIAEGCTPI